MSHEVDPSLLPTDLQTKLEERKALFELPEKLSASCVNILSEKGKLQDINYSDWFGRLTKFIKLGLTKDESTKATIFQDILELKDGTEVSVSISSLGSAAPKDARHILIFIPEIERLHELVLDKDTDLVKVWHAFGPGKYVRDANGRDLINYFGVVNLLEKNLQKK